MISIGQKHKVYFENGNLKETENTKGIPVKTWTFYHENGQVKATGLYVKRAKEGTWNYYHENGLFQKPEILFR
ncbi:MAG: hypothetical protein IPO32_20325 [Crocinitomicaceae bacterium]|nr:hypothetical protein [Crocinitomicaceae bacterium]